MFTPMGQEHHTRERIDRYRREADTHRALAAARETPPRLRRRESLLIRALRLLLG
jgi:hypothetical protein